MGDYQEGLLVFFHLFLLFEVNAHHCKPRVNTTVRRSMVFVRLEPVSSIVTLCSVSTVHSSVLNPHHILCVSSVGGHQLQHHVQLLILKGYPISQW